MGGRGENIGGEMLFSLRKPFKNSFPLARCFFPGAWPLRLFFVEKRLRNFVCRFSLPPIINGRPLRPMAIAMGLLSYYRLSFSFFFSLLGHQWIVFPLLAACQSSLAYLQNALEFEFWLQLLKPIGHIYFSRCTGIFHIKTDRKTINGFRTYA